MKVTYIYALQDPRDGRYYYIGKSDNPHNRYLQHTRQHTSNKEKIKWIGELRSIGLAPILQILEKVDVSEWQEAEKRWIATEFENGQPLTNILAGGDDPKSLIENHWRELLGCYLTPELLDKFMELALAEKNRVIRLVALCMLRYGKGLRRIGLDYLMIDKCQYYLGRKVACYLVTNQ